MSDKKVNVCVSGALGKRLGQPFIELASKDPGIGQIVQVDLEFREADPFRVHPDFLGAVLKGRGEVGRSDVLLIVHNDPNEVVDQARVAERLEVPVVIGTTGLGQLEFEAIRELGQRIPIAVSFNFSREALDWIDFCGERAKRFPDAYFSIYEEHHAEKKDVPSGTAMSGARAICSALGWNPEKSIKVGLPAGSYDTPHPQNVVYVNSVRGGAERGLHVLVIKTPDGTNRYSSQITSPDVFVRGALRVVKKIVEMPPGAYTMADF